jgi:hypothetical protein
VAGWRDCGSFRERMTNRNGNVLSKRIRSAPVHRFPKMKFITARFPFVATLSAFALFFAVSTTALAIDLRGPIGGLTVTQGSGTSTVIDLAENPDGTVALEAVQSGYLSHLGAFTASFSYKAHIDYNTGTTLITGDGTIMLTPKDKLFVAVTILEVGIDYPRPYTGILTITGGTGRYGKASGFFEVTGVDEESLTDSFVLAGVILTRR